MPIQRYTSVTIRRKEFINRLILAHIYIYDDYTLNHLRVDYEQLAISNSLILLERAEGLQSSHYFLRVDGSINIFLGIQFAFRQEVEQSMMIQELPNSCATQHY